jgi:hypothetical protein
METGKLYIGAKLHFFAENHRKVVLRVRRFEIPKSDILV